MSTFKESILEGIPKEIPSKKEFDTSINQDPKRKDIISLDEKKLAIKNDLRYFTQDQNEFLSKEFEEELKEFGRI